MTIPCLNSFLAPPKGSEVGTNCLHNVGELSHVGGVLYQVPEL